MIVCIWAFASWVTKCTTACGVSWVDLMQQHCCRCSLQQPTFVSFKLMSAALRKIDSPNSTSFSFRCCLHSCSQFLWAFPWVIQGSFLFWETCCVWASTQPRILVTVHITAAIHVTVELYMSDAQRNTHVHGGSNLLGCSFVLQGSPVTNKIRISGLLWLLPAELTTEFHLESLLQDARLPKSAF